MWENPGGLAKYGLPAHFAAMQTPRWFYTLVAVCLVILSVDATVYLLGPARDHRYSTGPEHFSVVDGRTGKMCQMNGPTAVVCWNPMATDSGAVKP
jgi:hypothetical protein